MVWPLRFPLLNCNRQKAACLEVSKLQLIVKINVSAIYIPGIITDTYKSTKIQIHPIVVVNRALMNVIKCCFLVCAHFTIKATFLSGLDGFLVNSDLFSLPYFASILYSCDCLGIYVVIVTSVKRCNVMVTLVIHTHTHTWMSGKIERMVHRIWMRLQMPTATPW